MNKKIKTVKKEVVNMVKLMGVLANDCDLAKAKVFTPEDCMALLSKTSGVVAGAKWKQFIPSMMDHVGRHNKVVAVCTVKDLNSDTELLMMVTDMKVLLSDGSTVLNTYYEEIEFLLSRKGVVSNYMELETITNVIQFTWCNKKTGKFMTDLIIKKVREVKGKKTWKDGMMGKVINL